MLRRVRVSREQRCQLGGLSVVWRGEESRLTSGKVASDGGKVEGRHC